MVWLHLFLKRVYLLNQVDRRASNQTNRTNRTT